MPSFNVTGICIPGIHYMVDITNKLNKIKALIDEGHYFTINRARQYGKTTTLNLLKHRLSGEYISIMISFEGLGDESFATPEAFCTSFTRKVGDALSYSGAESDLILRWKASLPSNFDELSTHIGNICTDKAIVLMIDEVDKVSNNTVFVNFLGMIRDKYLARAMGRDHSFRSVILTGVTDIKNIKLLLIQRGTHNPNKCERIQNSPWNIAADFDIDMSFNASEIASMLDMYERDHCIGMDITTVSSAIYQYTNGYPYLVSRICKHIDERLKKDWTEDGVKNAVKIILSENITLVDDLFKNLEANDDLRDVAYRICVKGDTIPFAHGVPAIDIGFMYGILNSRNGIYNDIKISNKIFEMLIYDYFTLKDILSNTPKITGVLKDDIVSGGRFDMVLCLEHFADHYAQTFVQNDARFLEQHARQVFLTYLKPLVNGMGFYHIESQLLDQRRMDIVVDYGMDQFIVELKIWHGERRHEDAYKQLCGYLDTLGMEMGYLLTFDFRKDSNKEFKAQWIEFEGKQIFDVIV